MVKAIFFDLDGVLIDSERAKEKIFEDYVDLKGYAIPHERFYRLIGSHKSLDPWKSVMEGLDLPKPYKEIAKEIEEYEVICWRELDLKKIIFHDVLPSLKKIKASGIKTALASSSDMEYIKRILAIDDLESWFDLVVSCDDFKKSKPDPEIYLYCLNYFGLSKDECLVIEDSPFGILAAKNAGIKVYARKDYFFGLDQSAADGIFDNLEYIIDSVISYKIKEVPFQTKFRP